MEKYYISSSKYTIESRETKKNGVLYDIRFRVMETDTYRIVHKRLIGYKTKTAAREAYMDFVTKNCTLHFWTRDQFETFISVVDDPVYRCLFTLLFFTGMRISEALALSPSDIRDGSISISKSLTTQTNGNGGWLIVPTKAYKNHIVPLCEPDQKAIRQYMEIAEMPLSQSTPHEIQDFGKKTGNHPTEKQKANKGHCGVSEMAYMKTETVKKGSKEISENMQTFFFGGLYPCSADSIKN